MVDEVVDCPGSMLIPTLYGKMHAMIDDTEATRRN
jgi:hypothetical protein